MKTQSTLWALALIVTLCGCNKDKKDQEKHTADEHHQGVEQSKVTADLNDDHDHEGGYHEGGKDDDHDHEGGEEDKKTLAANNADDLYV